MTARTSIIEDVAIEHLVHRRVATTEPRKLGQGQFRCFVPGLGNRSSAVQIPSPGAPVDLLSAALPFIVFLFVLTL